MDNVIGTHPKFEGPIVCSKYDRTDSYGFICTRGTPEKPSDRKDRTTGILYEDVWDGLVSVPCGTVWQDSSNNWKGVCLGEGKH